MRRILTIAFSVIVLMMSGNTLSYAAFPLDGENTSAAVVVPDNTTPVASQMRRAEESAPKPANDSNVKKKKGKSQLIALILSFFVGVLGIHRFYLGYTWQGIVQLLTAGGLGIWALIDFIRIAITDLEPKNEAYEKTLKKRR